MPMLTSAARGSLGIQAGSPGFSTKARTRASPSTLTTPNALAFSSGTCLGREAVVLVRAHQAPIIVTFDTPDDPAYVFADIYERVRAKGYILYSGKLTTLDTFRVGCIGALGADTIRTAMQAIAAALRETGVVRLALQVGRALEQSQDQWVNHGEIQKDDSIRRGPGSRIDP